MKKSRLLLTVLLGFCFCLSSLVILTACKDSHIHEYTEQVIQPTCTQKGVKTYTCECGHSYTEDIEVLMHDIETHEAKEPTCAEVGWEEYESCKREGCNYSTYIELPITGKHTWDEGKITTQPTCTEKGTKTFTCTVCKEATTTEEVDELKHDIETHEAKEPTCAEVGWEEYESCKREGCKYST